MRASYSRVCIEAFGFELPPNVVTSAQLEERLAAVYRRLEIRPGNLEALTGIRERRFFDPGVTSSAVATTAARKALARAGIGVEQVDCIVNTSIDREYFEPASSCFIHANLKCRPDVALFDVSNACLGFLNGLSTVANMIELGQIDCGLVVDAEADGIRRSVEMAVSRLSLPEATQGDVLRLLASLTVGCGAVAAVLRRADLATSGHRLAWSVTRAATHYSRACVGEIHGPGEYLLITEPRQMLKGSMDLLKEAWSEAGQSFGAHQHDHAFGHQVSSMHASAIGKALKVDASKVHHVYPMLGNVGPAGLPLAVAMTEAEGKLHSGERLVLVGCGSGLNCMVMGVQW